MKKYKKWAAAALLLLVLLAAAGYTVFIQQGQGEEQYVYLEEEVLFGSLVQGLTENGTVTLLTSSQTYELALETENEEDEKEEDTEKYLKIEEVYIVPGERISEGNPVFALNEKSIADVRRQLQSLQTDAQITLAQAQEEYELGVLSAGYSYQESVLAGDTAETEFQISSAMLEKEIRQSLSRIRILEQEIEQMEAELEDSWEDYDELRAIYEEAEYDFEKCDESTITKYITLRDVWLEAKERYEQTRDDRLDTREQIAEKQEEIAKIQVETTALQNKAERKNLDAKQSYESAVLEKELAEEVYGYTVEALSEEVDAAKTALTEAEENLKAFEEFVGDGTVYAQGSGLVTEVNYEEGGYLTGTGNLFSYVEEGSYVILVDVSEEDIPAIQVGDSVAIVMNAYEGEKWTGTVSAINTSASENYAATVSYPVTVQIEGDTARLYGGMSADVTFVTKEADEVLYVSRKAVIEQDGGTWVYTGNETEKELTEVETGFTDGIHIQITRGLSEGDTIYIKSRVVGGVADE